MKISHITLALAAAALATTGANAKNPMVGGAAMYETKNIVENAAASADHKTLVAAVKAAGLVDTLLLPENKAKLTGILTYHVLPGRLTAADIAAKAAANGGKAVLTTVEGEALTVWQKDGSWYVSDAKGGKAKIGPADVLQSNGVIHVIDAVLMP